MFKNAKYDNQENTAISVLHDGVHLSITVDKKNRHYQELMEQKVPIADYVPPAITVKQVKKEAQRRISQIMPAHKQSNNNEQVTNNILAHGLDVINWPAAKRKAHNAAASKWSTIKTIREMSNALEIMNPIPQDYADDQYWP